MTNGCPGSAAEASGRAAALRTAVAAAIGVIALLVGAVAAPAQVIGADVPTSPCVDSLPPAALHRVAVYVEADSTQNMSTQLASGFRILASYVAQQVDSMLGGREGTLPHGEPSLSWREVGFGRIAVTAHRDGRLTWDARTSRPLPASMLLGHALDAVVASHVEFSWPGDLPGDSAVALIRVTLPSIHQDGSVHYDHLDPSAEPAFSMAMPSWDPVEALPDNPRPTYPSDLEQANMGGMVLMQFVVDTSGRVEANTARDLWYRGQKRPTGRMLNDYRELRDAVEDVLPRMRFRPARINGCPVRQLVQMPFVFGLVQRVTEVP